VLPIPLLPQPELPEPELSQVAAGSGTGARGRRSTRGMPLGNSAEGGVAGNGRATGGARIAGAALTGLGPGTAAERTEDIMVSWRARRLVNVTGNCIFVLISQGLFVTFRTSGLGCASGRLWLLWLRGTLLSFVIHPYDVSVRCRKVKEYWREKDLEDQSLKVTCTSQK
jgi:hypothetical protein